MFKRVFEKRTEEGRPIFFAAGLKGELVAAVQDRGDLAGGSHAMSKSDFGRVLEKFGDPALARNPLLAEALFRAAAGPGAELVDIG